MLKRDRLDLHKKIADTLAANFPAIAKTEPEILAHHYTRAELADAAVPNWLAAGQLALSRFAPTEALGHLDSGLRLVNRLAESPDRDRLELALHMATASAYNATQGWASDRTKATYDRALPIIQRLGSDESTFDTMIGIYYFYNVRGLMEEGTPVIVDAVNYADRQGSAANKLVAYQAFGQNTLYRGEFSKSVDCLETSMSVYERAKHAALANVWGTDFYASDLAWLGSVYWLVGWPDQASMAVERAREHAQSMHQANTEAWVEAICSLARLLQGELDLAVETAISACQKASGIDFKIMEHIARAVLGAARILQGANSVGISGLESGLASFEGLGGGSFVPWWKSILGFGYAKDGRFDDAQRLLDDAGRQAEFGGQIWSDPIINEMRGKVSLLKGERAQAIDHFKTGFEIAHNLASPSLALRLATNLAVLVDPEAGRSILRPVYHQFTEGFSAPDLRAAKQVLETLN
jgi:tetratricopeptide (TPR) repeat protein